MIIAAATQCATKADLVAVHDRLRAGLVVVVVAILVAFVMQALITMVGSFGRGR